MNIHFTLRKQGSGDPKIILNVYDSRLKGRKFMYSTSKSIPKNHWDTKNSRAKLVTGKAEHYRKLNLYIDKIEKAVLKYETNHLEDKILDRSGLKSFITEALEISPSKINRTFQIKLWTKSGNILTGPEHLHYNLNLTLNSLASLAKFGIVPRIGESIHIDDADLESWTNEAIKLFTKHHHIDPRSPLQINDVHYKPTKGGTEIFIIFIVTELR